MFKWFCFCFLNGTLPDLVKAIDCFTKLDVTMALPLVVFELNSITASLGGFSACYLLDLGHSDSQKHLLKVHARRQHSGVNNTGINISIRLFLPDN